MDNRLDAFIRKFTDAQKYLGGNSVYELVSIKYRENVNYSTYKEFVDDYLPREMNFEIKDVIGDFQGNVWLVRDSKQNKVLLIEHESGLEILYIAGSIASLVSLVPLINSGWKLIRSRVFNNLFPRDREMGIEIRLINNNDQLIEHRVMRVEDYVLSETMKEIGSLKERVEKLEGELKKVQANKITVDESKKHSRLANKSKK